MLTARQVATRFAVHPVTVSRLAREHGIGTLVNPRCRMFDRYAMAALKKVLKANESRPKPDGDEMRRRVMVRWEKQKPPAA